MEVYIGYIFFALFQICFIIQLYYVLVIQSKFSNYQLSNKSYTSEKSGVSVIICARNEAKNLTEYLPYVLEQKYPNFEVVVVNDCSYDGSEDVLRGFEEKYPHLKVVTIEEHPRFKTAKKFAATLGIKAATNDILLFTDADCKPESDYWIDLMAANYHDTSVEIVLGYSPYIKYKGLLNALIRYETFLTAINYFSFCLNGMPYMGIGRNLSYRKSLFFRGKGFAAHMHIPSGDDDLFVNQNANESNTVIEVDTNTFTYSKPKLTWSSYWKQKIRHLGAASMYKRSHRVNLLLQSFSAAGFYVFFSLCLSYQVELYVVLAVFFIRFLSQLYVYFKPMINLKSKDLRWWFILLDPFYYIYLIALSIASIFTKKVSWK